MYTDGHTLSRHDALPIASLVGSTIPDGLKRVLGRLGYIVWGLWSALRFRPFEVILTYKDGRSQRFRALELRIANGSYLGGTEVAEEAEVDSGEIIVQIVTGNGRSEGTRLNSSH